MRETVTTALPTSSCTVTGASVTLGTAEWLLLMVTTA